jgi:mRNA interferase RelE/StbE
VTRYSVEYSPAAVRAISGGLPEKIATAAIEFIEGPLADNPRRVGKRLRAPFARYYGARRGQYRVMYEILDDVVRISIVVVAHRRDIYRRR